MQDTIWYAYMILHVLNKQSVAYIFFKIKTSWYQYVILITGILF